MRSFSNLWFWLSLAVMWSSVSHRVLGVPWDLATRAQRAVRRAPDADATLQATRDFEDMVRIQTNRILFVTEQSGLLLAGLSSFLLTVLATLGFVYRNECSQALFLLAFPLALLGMMTLRTAHIVRHNDLSGAALFRRLYRHRTQTQVLGAVSIFVTAMWGMYQNLLMSPIFG